ncbi:hypothetical protein JZ751_028831 [Albula glossodonta]|uniref:RFX-type winged-helix domain-containing protein n=1 Tax=Albula glossodonta TaxID=121402 RepID=A0A8T2NDM5_9TELE|nr:hypothetical protein JZ751_028831 [Albula glossodonta]
MATSGYVEDLQQPSQPQGGSSVTVASGQPSAPPPAAPSGPPQFLAELQTNAAATPTAPPTPAPTGQTTPPASAPPQQPQKTAGALATPTQAPTTQYVTAEIQSATAQPSNGQSTPQYIVVTVTVGAQPVLSGQSCLPVTASLFGQAVLTESVHKGSLHSSDSVSDSSPPPAAAQQTGVPTQVVQQVQTAQQRSVVQAVSQPAKTAQSAQLTVTNLQPVHLSQEVQQQLQQVPVQHVYSSQVQYVEGGDVSYTTSTIRSGSYTYSDTPLYTQTASGSYYEATPASGSQTVSVTTGGPTVSMFVSGAGQIVANTTSGTSGGGTVVAGTAPSAAPAAGATSASAGGSYVIQGGYVLGSSNTNQNYSHNTRASPATVQWLLDNYETAEGVSLPRSTLYCHYLLHCQEQKLEPVNAASFGKLIRSVFLGLRTRRLGTRMNASTLWHVRTDDMPACCRGNSKYHYYGLRIKASSSLLRLMEDQQHLAMRQQPFSQKQRLKPVQKVEGMTNGMGLGAGQQQTGGLSDISAQVQQYQQFLVGLTKRLLSLLPDASRALPEFPEIDLQGKALPDGIVLEHIKGFQVLYREHCEAILDVMINLQFTLVETLWKSFWRFSESQASESDTMSPVLGIAALCSAMYHWTVATADDQGTTVSPSPASHEESEKRLPKSCLVLLCKYDPVLRWSRDCDNALYQGLVEILIPDVLRPIPSEWSGGRVGQAQPGTQCSSMVKARGVTVCWSGKGRSALTQAIRNFAKSLESWLTNAMMNIPEEMVRIKVTSANAFAQTLRRYTSLNHLAQAARAVLQNTAQINQMLSDLNRVDFANVQEQASWVCRCEDRVVQRLEQDFKLTLQQQNSLEQWAAWLDSVVSQVLKPYQASATFPKAAKLFLLKWSFYRDLTLRSAASFGSFHLIRLLYDEYMYYLIEHRVAQAKGETPIAVMGEFASLGRSLNTLDPDKEEEEEEEEESEDECQELSLQSEPPGLGEESLEPPAKLARTDTQALFNTGHGDN